MAEEYRKETENKYLDKISEICKILPKVVTRYERSVQQVTEVKSRYAYLCDIKTFIEYLSSCIGIPMTEITPADLEAVTKDDFEDYINYLQKYEKNGKVYTNGKASIKRKISALRNLYSYMFKSDLVHTCNIEKVDMPKLKKKEIVYMDSDEASDFIDIVSSGSVSGTMMEKIYHDKLGYRNFVIVNLMLSTGIRVSELVGLDVNDVDLKNSCIHVIRKGNVKDTVYFPDDIRDVLDEYTTERCLDTSADTSALFLSTRKTRLSVRSVENIIKKYARKAVPLKDIHCHSTRSSFAMEFLKNSEGDIEGLQSALGHASIATSQFYARSTQDMKKSKKEMVNFTRKK